MADRNIDLNPDRVTDGIDRRTTAAPDNEILSFSTVYGQIRSVEDGIGQSITRINSEIDNLRRDAEQIEKQIAIRSEEINRLERLGRPLQEIRESVEGVKADSDMSEKVAYHEEYAKRNAEGTYISPGRPLYASGLFRGE